MQGTENRTDQEKKSPGHGNKISPARFGTLVLVLVLLLLLLLFCSPPAPADCSAEIAS
jgi:hypothetical protein